jgi:hypothetical protein
MRPRLGSIRQIAETTILTPRIEPEKEDSSRCTIGSSLNFERRICDLTRSRENFRRGWAQNWAQSAAIAVKLAKSR